MLFFALNALRAYFLETGEKMINEEMAKLGKKRSVIREIFEYANKRKAEIGEEKVFDFSIGNPSVPTPQEVTETMERLIKETAPVKLHGYTSAQGAPACRKAIADNLNARFGTQYTGDQLYLTAGAAASISPNRDKSALQ